MASPQGDPSSENAHTQQLAALQELQEKGLLFGSSDMYVDNSFSSDPAFLLLFPARDELHPIVGKTEIYSKWELVARGIRDMSNLILQNARRLSDEVPGADNICSEVAEGFTYGLLVEATANLYAVRGSDG